jgi:hypothetical protein
LLGPALSFKPIGFCAELFEARALNQRVAGRADERIGTNLLGAFWAKRHEGRA